MLGGGAKPLQVETRATSGEASGTTPTISLPSGIVSGDRIVVMMSMGVGITVTNWDVTKDFTEIILRAGGEQRIVAAYRDADGTEGATIDATLSGASPTAHCAYRISGHHSDAPEASGAGGDTTDPNPPNLTPTGGSLERLWLAACVGENTLSGNPDNYTDVLYFAQQSDRQIRSAERILDASSEDPTVYTMSSGEWAAITISIEPA